MARLQVGRANLLRSVPCEGPQRAASVLSQKFVEEASGEDAGPSTTFVAKNAPNFAQDDSVSCLANLRLRTLVPYIKMPAAWKGAEGILG